MEKFLQKRDILSVFQAPDNGETVEFNPPGLVCLYRSSKKAFIKRNAKRISTVDENSLIR